MRIEKEGKELFIPLDKTLCIMGERDPSGLFATNKFDCLVYKVEGWAEEKEIFAKATPLTQHSKTQEEVDELKQALEENDREEIVDAIGDILVTLIIQAKMNDLNIVECLESAYNVISKRTGTIVNGIFVKDK